MEEILILITNYFPYYKGEEYIESELPILSEKFDKVFILSCMIDDNREPTRSVPENVIVIPSGVNHDIFGRAKMIFNSLITKGKERNDITFAQNMYSRYFEARSKMISKQFQERLGKYNINNNSNIIIYSYWIYITARVGIELRNTIFKNSENVKLISRAHRYDLYENATKFNFLPERKFILSSLDVIYPVSNDGTTYLKRKYPEYFDKISTKYLGTEKPNVRLDLNKTPFRIVSCSVLRPVKRVKLIIEAISILQKDGYNVYWTHVGDGEEFEDIKKMAGEKLRLDTYSLPGFVENNKIFQLYKSHGASVFVNVSESEGLPVSIMEAASIGLPIIATDVGGTKEIVYEKNGILLKENLTAEILADAIKNIYLLEDQAIKELSFNSIKIWEERFNALTNYNKFSEEIRL